MFLHAVLPTCAKVVLFSVFIRVLWEKAVEQLILYLKQTQTRLPGVFITRSKRVRNCGGILVCSVLIRRAAV